VYARLFANQGCTVVVIGLRERLTGMVVRICKDKYWKAVFQRAEFFQVRQAALQMMVSITLAVFARPDVSLISKACE
jgi:hypothetical protein